MRNSTMSHGYQDMKSHSQIMGRNVHFTAGGPATRTREAQVRYSIDRIRCLPSRTVVAMCSP